MKSEKKIFTAFLLNLFFSVIEFVGGSLTGSVAIISDSIHDLGDCLSIGASFILEKWSKKSPDSKYTYGYLRFSVLGGIIQSVILLTGSLIVVYNAVLRLISPVEINYNGMIILAFVGAAVNLAAAYFTVGGDSINQKAVNLHLIEDVLGWIVVLIGAIVMKLFDISFLDPLLSIGVALFIIVNVLKNLKEVLDLFLEKTPDSIDLEELQKHILNINGVEEVHHFHVRSIDGFSHLATLHIVTGEDFTEIKRAVKEELSEHGVTHSTIELEAPDEICDDKCCSPVTHHEHNHHHH